MNNEGIAWQENTAEDSHRRCNNHAGPKPGVGYMQDQTIHVDVLRALLSDEKARDLVYVFKIELDL